MCITRGLSGLALLVLIAACGNKAQQTLPLEVKNDTACVLDGMLLNDFPGPKAQILYAEGKADFFCDLIELFAVLQVPEQKRPISAVYVQDMAKTEWDHPRAQWIDAKKAFYVVGSNKTGSMGATFASFLVSADAEAFAGKHGGQVTRFEQVTPAMLSKKMKN